MKIITLTGGDKVSKRSVKLRRKRLKAGQFARKRKRGSVLKKAATSRKNRLSQRIKDEDKRFRRKLVRKGLLKRDPNHYQTKNK
tara:strand:+ start:120 stop:371 length:252 start_codon:yes stop_codon:yes gene_type:complete